MGRPCAHSNMKQVGLLLVAIGLATAILLWVGTVPPVPPFTLTDAYLSDGGRRPLGWAFRLLLMSGGGLLAGWEALRSKPQLRGLAVLGTGLFLAATAVAGVYSSHGMWSLALTVPLGVVLVVAGVGGRDERTQRELEAFVTFPAREARAAAAEAEAEAAAPGYREAPPGIDRSAAPYRADHLALRGEPNVAKLRRVDALPANVGWILPSVGDGKASEVFVLHSGLAYVVFVEADDFSTADHVSVVMKLEERAPAMLVRPLPIVEGKPVANTGVPIKKDPEFMASFLVEALTARDPKADAKAVRSFLSEPVRDALLDLPIAWLRVERDVMALTLYGRFDSDHADALVETADVLFAEHGGGGGPSLLSPEVDAPPPTAKKKLKKKKASPAAPTGQAAESAT
jgi:hypothetical protein